jgi:hypothetical protein
MAPLISYETTLFSSLSFQMLSWRGCKQLCTDDLRYSGT